VRSRPFSPSGGVAQRARRDGLPQPHPSPSGVRSSARGPAPWPKAGFLPAGGACGSNLNNLFILTAFFAGRSCRGAFESCPPRGVTRTRRPWRRDACSRSVAVAIAYLAAVGRPRHRAPFLVPALSGDLRPLPPPLPHPDGVPAWRGCDWVGWLTGRQAGNLAVALAS